jgi:hypothetical protein
MFSFSKLALFFTLGAAALVSAAPVYDNGAAIAARCNDGKCAGKTLAVIFADLTTKVTPVCHELRM